MNNKETKSLLRQFDIKATRRKVAILEEMTRSFRPFDAYELHRSVSEKVRVDLATVYRTLAQFKEHGIIREIYDRSTVLYYEVVNQEKVYHPHFKCVHCLQYFCLPSLDSSETNALSRIARNFKVNDVAITMSGLCEQCLEENQ